MLGEGQMNDQSEVSAVQAPTRRGRGCLLWLGAGLAVVLGLLLVGYMFEPEADAADAKTYPPPGELVDIGGYRLHINCMGSGSPTVVIDAGWGDWSTAWGMVQSEVAQTTRVCTYDRAGTGWSDAGPLPRDATQFAKELHVVLQNAHVPGPYVLAGHSLGGLPVRVFAGTYPSEVAGVVLIDSMTPQQFTQAPAAGKSQPAPQSQPLSQPLSLPAMLARFGVVRLLARPLGLIPSSSPNEAAAYSRIVRPQNVQAYMDEGEGMPAAGAEAGAVQSFGDLPLIVLTAKLNKMPNWQERQAELLKLSSNSVQLFADSDHNIHLEAPGTAVAAIDQMVAQVRQTVNQTAHK
jgi:pimeloyl-ACP methyl ester carboxylesterase